MTTKRSNATTSSLVRAAIAPLVALVCVLLAAKSVAEPPSFLDDNQRRSVPQRQPPSKPKILIARNAEVSQPRPVATQANSKPNSNRFSENEQLPQRQKKSVANQPSNKTTNGAVVTIVSSLAIVLGAFLLLVWFSRKALPRANSTLPTEAVELLGKSVVGGKQQLQLLRIGNKLLLINVTATGAETLTEISDPNEVERLVAICTQNQPGSITATFRQVLSQFGSERPPSGSADT